MKLRSGFGSEVTCQQCKRVRVINKSLAKFLGGPDATSIVWDDTIWCEKCPTYFFDFWKAHNTRRGCPNEAE